MLTANYDALLLAYGASKDKRLGIPGEDLAGVHSARAFVGWYNGLPEYADLKPDLGRSDTAVIIGQGNVAMDVARILLAPLAHLRQTDITEEALQFLDKSRVKDVRIVGRRGPLQAAYTTKELRELVKLEKAHLRPFDRSALPRGYTDPKDLPRGGLRRQMELLWKASPVALAQAEKTWSLEYMLSPTRFEEGPPTGQLARVHFQRNEYLPDSREAADREQGTADQHVDYLRALRVRPKKGSDPLALDTGLAFRSVGYKSEALQGLSHIGVPFDEQMGIIPNDLYGRIMNPSKGPGELTAGHVPGMYAAGWVKRGPTGVIASTMDDAFISADVLRQDWASGALFLQQERAQPQGWDAVKNEAEQRGIQTISWQDWLRIDEAEKRRGKDKGKEREKFRSVDEMLAVVG